MNTDQGQTGSGDHVGGDKIGEQINITDGATYNETHIYGDKKIRRHLTLLPFFPDGSKGSEIEFTTIHKRMFEGRKLLLLMND